MAKPYNRIEKLLDELTTDELQMLRVELDKRMGIPIGVIEDAPSNDYEKGFQHGFSAGYSMGHTYGGIAAVGKMNRISNEFLNPINEVQGELFWQLGAIGSAAGASGGDLQVETIRALLPGLMHNLAELDLSYRNLNKHNRESDITLTLSPIGDKRPLKQVVSDVYKVGALVVEGKAAPDDLVSIIMLSEAKDIFKQLRQTFTVATGRPKDPLVQWIIERGLEIYPKYANRRDKWVEIGATIVRDLQAKEALDPIEDRVLKHLTQEDYRRNPKKLDKYIKSTIEKHVNKRSLKPIA
jgi:hypothetical protein